LAFFAGLYAYKFLDKSLRLILLYTIIGFSTELSLWIAVKSGVRNTMPSLHFYVMFEFLIWAIFYMNQLRGFVKRKYMLVLIILFESYCIINMIFIQKLTEYAFTRSIEYLIISLLAVILYTKVMSEAKILKLALSPLIWINTAVFLYFSGNFFFNVVFINLLEKNSQLLRELILSVFVTFNTLFYLGISIGFILQRVSFSKKEI
jgi:hypothetical protein